MKKHLLTGFIILLPLALTLMIVAWLIDFFTTPFVGIVEHFVFSFEKTQGLRTETLDFLIMFLSRLIVLVFLFCLCFILGFFARKYFFNALLQLGNKFLSRIPVVKSIYSISRDVTKAVFSGKEKTFKKTVLVPFPEPETYAMAFVTGDIPEGVKKIVRDEHLSIFVPTAPHPMSGYMLIAPRRLIYDVDVTTEEAFKFLLSCGASVPGEQKPEAPK